MMKKTLSSALVVLLLSACATTYADKGTTSEDIRITINNSRETTTSSTINAELFELVVVPSNVPTARPTFNVAHKGATNIVPPTPKPTKRPSGSSFVVASNLSIAEGKAIAKNYARMRVSATQYSCLIDLWNKESGWNYRSLNTSSGAYGIPQALPGSKMSSSGEDWRTNPVTQVKWGIGYVNGRYGSACGAWKFWLNNRWY